MNPGPFTVAAAQAAPVFLDRSATVAKACDLIAEAAQNGARLIVFPESYIPTYPDWVWAVPPGEYAVLRDLYAEFHANSLTIPGEDTRRLCEAARRAHIYVVMGLSERNAEASGASLYNTLLLLGPEGIELKHRKLVPTAAERLVWAPRPRRRARRQPGANRQAARRDQPRAPPTLGSGLCRRSP